MTKILLIARVQLRNEYQYFQTCLSAPFLPSFNFGKNLHPTKTDFFTLISRQIRVGICKYKLCCHLYF